MHPHNPLPTLPLHLMLSASASLSSTIASVWLKTACTHWNLPEKQKSLLEDLPLAVAGEARSRYEKLLNGIRRYQDTELSRDVEEPPCIWQSGNVRLLDYGIYCSKKNAPRLLLVPSLINRYYILDLSAKQSFARYLAARGIYPLMLDWGAPGKTEAAYDAAAYVTNPLADAVAFIARTTGAPVHLAGYCMGGVLTTALAVLQPENVASLSLLATPWDFHAPDCIRLRLGGETLHFLEQLITENSTVPPEWIQALFYWQQPWAFQQKFEKFAEAGNSRNTRDFLNLEGWVNDGVPMTPALARDCFIGWAQHNVLAKKQWRVNGTVIDPSRVEKPVFLTIPQNDSVVPKQCALALAPHFKNATIHEPKTGHVGMIIGSKAKAHLWEPYADWLAGLDE